MAVEAGEVSAGEQKEGEDVGAYSRRAQRQVDRGVESRYDVGRSIDKLVYMAVGNPCRIVRPDTAVEGGSPAYRLFRRAERIRVGCTLRHRDVLAEIF